MAKLLVNFLWPRLQDAWLEKPQPTAVLPTNQFKAFGIIDEYDGKIPMTVKVRNYFASKSLFD